MAVNDPTSLDSLVDIVTPPPAAWWPLAPGWIVLLVVGCLLLVVRVVDWMRIWKQNAYRRIALIELDRLNAAPDRQQWADLPVLLKRTALAAWPRSDVAALSGKEWLEFLNRTGRSPQFSERVGERLLTLSYEPKTVDRLSPTEFRELVEASRDWIGDHARPEVDRC